MELGVVGDDGNQGGTPPAPPADAAAVENGKKLWFSKRQWMFLLIFGLANIFRGVTVLIVFPFYPDEAKERGITESQYGFVFGAFDYSTFAVVLFFGKFVIPKLGPRLTFKLSTFNLGICTILFGCLVLTDNGTVFLVLSIIIRVIAGAGDAGFYPSAFTIFAEEFQDVSTAIGLFEFMFGIGAILGPVVFSSFIDYTGFLVVYVIVGLCLLVSGILVHFFTPNPIAELDNKDTDDLIQMPSKDTLSGSSDGFNKPVTTLSSGTKKRYQLFMIPAVIVIIVNHFTTAASIGFISGSLDGHLEQFNLTTFHTGLVFPVSNTIYTLSAPLWGKFSDSLQGRWKSLTIFIGTALILAGFSFLGPLPFLADHSNLWSTLVGLALHGLGIGAAIMSTFPHARSYAIENGFTDSLETQSWVSSVYILTFTLGNAVGPSVAGVLVENTNFQQATFFILGLCLIAITGTAAQLLLTIRK